MIINRRKSIRSILSTYFLILASAILIAVSAFYTFLQYRTLRDQARKSLSASADSTAVSMRQALKEMDTILLYSIASPEMKSAFSQYCEEITPFLHNRARGELASELIRLKGFNFDVIQLNVYGIDGGGYGVGGYNGDLGTDVKGEAWYEEAFSRGGRIVIAAPERDEFISRAAGLDEDTLYIAVYRMFYNEFHVPMGFIGVKERYDRFFSSVIAKPKPYAPETSVYDEKGVRLYPERVYASSPEGMGEALKTPQERVQKTGEITDRETGRKRYVAVSEIADYALTINTAVYSSELYAPVYRNLVTGLTVVLIVFALCLFSVFFLSRRLSDPLFRMYAFLSDREKGQFKKLELEDTGVREIDTLRDSLNDSITAQENATRTMLTLKEQEVQAQMLALQAQMNPHFLYNSLSAIGEMADEGNVSQVSEMCEGLTSILRYISSNREQRIRVEEELEQVDIYLNIMKKRFGNDLSYVYRVDDEILDCMVPKLCVQLLVENAIKSVTKMLPPWEIRVEGHREGEDWSVTVLDNGSGFDAETDRYLRSCMDDILETGTLPSLKIKGMGILNIFIRLYLLDGIPFIFDFGNRPEGGAFVKVGGHVHEKDRAL
ncbi:MAG TPA: sensor histidine kinase [Lachnospiraceae bacterium]|nr:sensor histidine kinase [Lachnospiraceae bacterium]